MRVCQRLVLRNEKVSTFKKVLGYICGVTSIILLVHMSVMLLTKIMLLRKTLWIWWSKDGLAEPATVIAFCVTV